MREYAIQYWAGISRNNSGAIEEDAPLQDQALISIEDANQLNPIGI